MDLLTAVAWNLRPLEDGGLSACHNGGVDVCGMRVGHEDLLGAGAGS
jgi:hypothetical protein